MINNKLTKLIIVVGPTASGKSDLAVKLARKLDGEIISADSRQVYRGMDIGTGKITKKEQDGIRHHLISVVSPKKVFTASDFKELGDKAIREITGRNKIPVVVGGTGFYIDILLGRMSTAEVPADQELRAKLAEQSAKQLFERLLKLDPERSKTIDHHNKVRLIRALEIILTTGKTIPKPTLDNRYGILWIGLRPENLDERIEKRLNKRVGQGMLEEVITLHKGGVSWKRFEDLGLEYRWISRYIRHNKNKINRQDFKKSEEYAGLLRDIVRYSKRQMTWFKRNKDINWIQNEKTAERLARRFLKSY